MKKTIALTLFLISVVMTFAQTKVRLTIGNNSMTATLLDNPATRELVSLLEKGPVTISMSDYGGFEKVGELPRSFTTTDSRITTTPGDIMLYQGDNMVIFYGTNTWSYTRLGRIDDATDTTLRSFLGTGTISLTMSLGSSTGVTEITRDEDNRDVVYDLKGNIIDVRPLPAGIYIVNGCKTVVRH